MVYLCHISAFCSGSIADAKTSIVHFFALFTAKVSVQEEERRAS